MVRKMMIKKVGKYALGLGMAIGLSAGVTQAKNGDYVIRANDGSVMKEIAYGGLFGSGKGTGYQYKVEFDNLISELMTSSEQSRELGTGFKKIFLNKDGVYSPVDGLDANKDGYYSYDELSRVLGQYSDSGIENTILNYEKALKGGSSSIKGAVEGPGTGTPGTGTGGNNGQTGHGSFD